MLALRLSSYNLPGSFIFILIPLPVFRAVSYCSFFRYSSTVPALVPIACALAQAHQFRWFFIVFLFMLFYILIRTVHGIN